MKEHHDDDRTRTVGMKAPQKRAARYFFHDVGNSRVRAGGRWHVIQRKDNPGDGLGNEKEQQNRAEHVSPARAAGNWFVQRLVQN